MLVFSFFAQSESEGFVSPDRDFTGKVSATVEKCLLPCGLPWVEVQLVWCSVGILWTSRCWKQPLCLIWIHCLLIKSHAPKSYTASELSFPSPHGLRFCISPYFSGWKALCPPVWSLCCTVSILFALFCTRS